jgi:hypothetical protein
VKATQVKFRDNFRAKPVNEVKKVKPVNHENVEPDKVVKEMKLDKLEKVIHEKSVNVLEEHSV